MPFATKQHHGGLLRHVPVRLLLVVLVLVPWSGMAYRTGDRIDHDYSELRFMQELAPAAVRIKFLAQIQRELEVERAAAVLKDAGSITDLPSERDLIESRRTVNNAISSIGFHGVIGIQRQELDRVRDQFDSPRASNDSAIGYNDLLGLNREALSASVRELWVLIALLGGDEAMRNDLRALELSLNATDASIRQSNLLLRSSFATTLDQSVVGLVEDEQRSAQHALQSIAALPVPVAIAANEAITSPDEKAIASATSRLAELSIEEPGLSIDETKHLYRLLEQRNGRLGEISDSAATALSARAQRLLNAERVRISKFIWWLLASLVLSLSIAALVGRALWRPIRQLGQQAVALVNGVENVQPIVPRGPRELVTSAHALNDLTETLIAVQKQADALAKGSINEAVHHAAPPSQLGSSVQMAVRRLSESIQLNNQLRDEFEHAANHDALTGLPNRAAVYRHLEQHLQTDEHLALLFVDLDRFKQVNDADGHLAGDEILRAMATRFVSCAGPDRMVARLGGDEFLVVCSGESVGAAMELADRIRAVAAEPVDLGHRSVRLGASAGWAAKQAGDTVSVLLKRADQALYVAKAAGRNPVSFNAEFAMVSDRPLVD